MKRIASSNPAPRERRGCTAVSFERPWRGVGEPER